MIQRIETLLEIDDVGQYSKGGDIITIELEYDDNDKPYYIVAIGNNFIMHGQNPKKWRRISNLRQSLMDYAVRGEYNLGSWSFGRL